jgi:hypothetical protein
VPFSVKYIKRYGLEVYGGLCQEVKISQSSAIFIGWPHVPRMCRQMTSDFGFPQLFNLQENN